MYRIVNDDGILSMYSQNQLCIENSSVDNDFIVNSKGNNYEIISKTLAYGSFWEDFFNDDAVALATFFNRYPQFKGFIFGSK
jgi:hypothetical protein